MPLNLDIDKRSDGGMRSATEVPTSGAMGAVSTELSELVLESPGPRRLLHSAAYQGPLRFTRRVLEVGVEVALARVTDIAMAHQLAQSQILRGEAGGAPATTAGRRIALYAHYSASGRISSMVCKQLACYQAHGFDVVFVTNSENVEEESWRAAATHCWYLVRRRNIGLDFGAWRDSAALLLTPCSTSRTVRRPGNRQLRRMRCCGACGGRVGAAWLVTGPILSVRVRPRRVALLEPEARE